MTRIEHTLLSISEAATYMGVHPRTVHRHIADGRLRAVRSSLNRRVYIRESDLVRARQEAVRRFSERLPEMRSGARRLARKR